MRLKVDPLCKHRVAKPEQRYGVSVEDLVTFYETFVDLNCIGDPRILVKEV